MSANSNASLRRILDIPMTLSFAEFGSLDVGTAGVAEASKAIVLGASKNIATITSATITTLTSTTVNTTTTNSTTGNVGASGTAGTLNVFPTTASKGKLVITAADNTNDDATTINKAAQGGAYTYTLPDFGSSADIVLASALAYKVDAVAMSPLKYVDVTVASTDLATAATKVVITGVSGDQYKIRNVRLVGGGTNYSAGGDRLLSLTDGTTVWTTIANADLESAPSATLDWGNAKVPFLTGTSDTASVSGQNIRFVYSGGTTDHTTGSIKFSVCLEKVA